MRTIEYGSTTHVPAFLTKLWKLVTDTSCDELICWSLAGTSFIIYDEIRFSKELLPMYFKHNNMASFVRQLNMYGFRKLSCIDQGGMHCYKNEIEFYHQYFIKGQESLLELIKRKIPNSRSEEPKYKQEYVEELIASIKTMKRKQDLADEGLQILTSENRQLWRHFNMLSSKCAQQQTILQQFLPLFLELYQNRQKQVSLKRKAPLMIDEGDEPNNKVARLSPPYYVQHCDQDSNQGIPSSPGNVTNRGPVIHEVTEMENKMYPGNILCASSPSNTKECDIIVDSPPLSCKVENSEQTIDSPFTEPAAMETINILNQNFESRSRSSSMSSAHSQASVSSPSSMRLSPSSVMSGSPGSSVSGYRSVVRSLPPTIIIDETTSDVPSVSDSMITNFAPPKLEDTCADSGIYTIESLISSRVPDVVNEATSSTLISRTSPLMNEGTSAMMGQKLLAANGEPSMINGSPMMAGPSSVLESKFLSNFAPIIKNIGSEVNWMGNQAASTSNSTSFVPEQNFENWLGQIFKSDNLTAGCSLPQGQIATGNYS